MGTFGKATMGLVKFKSSGLLTKLSVNDIEQLLLNYFGGVRSKNMFVPNISWGMFKYEMDFVVVTPQRYLYEIEIKRSWSDFMADFKKNHIHDDKHVRKFYYCVPQAMADKVCEFCSDRNIGVLFYTENKYMGARRGACINTNSINLNDDELFKLSRLATIRFWTHRNKGANEILKEQYEVTKSLLSEIKADFKAITGDAWRVNDI